MKIPSRWTFNDRNVAKNFTSHVKEQLPWYPMVTSAVAHIVEAYLPENGLMYDIGASNGNIGRACAATIVAREAEIVGIEPSMEMISEYAAPGVLHHSTAEAYKYKPFDVAVLMLTMMFVKPSERYGLLHNLRHAMRKGGVIIVVDKIDPHAGYFGTVMRRLVWKAKLDYGANPSQVLRKEMSLNGVQRPTSDEFWGTINGARKWFQFGEFAGYVIEG